MRSNEKEISELAQKVDLWRWSYGLLCTDGQMFFHWSSRGSLDHLKSCWRTRSSDCTQTCGVHAAQVLLSVMLKRCTSNT